MASPTRWTWVWASSRSWWWTGKPGVLQSMGSQRVRHAWATQLNTKYKAIYFWKIHTVTSGYVVIIDDKYLALSGGEGNGNPLQYSCLENPMDGGAWWAAVHGVARSRTRLRDFTFTFHFHALEKAMATHSSVLAWRIPGTGEPGGLPSRGSHRVGHDWSTTAAAEEKAHEFQEIGHYAEKVYSAPSLNVLS